MTVAALYDTLTLRTASLLPDDNTISKASRDLQYTPIWWFLTQADEQLKVAHLGCAAPLNELAALRESTQTNRPCHTVKARHRLVTKQNSISIRHKQAFHTQCQGKLDKLSVATLYSVHVCCHTQSELITMHGGVAAALKVLV